MNLDQLKFFKNRLEEIEKKLSDPQIYTSNQSANLINEQKELKNKIDLFELIKKWEDELIETKKLLDDPQMNDIATKEIKRLETDLSDAKQKLNMALLPIDPNDKRNAILEIRAGTGGDESSLFASELAKMYLKYLEKNGYKIEILSANMNDLGGYKEVIFEISGKGAYGKLKYESGVHRVQRVPETESSGRIHTSAVSIVVLPEAEETELSIDPSELRIDVYRSSGHGGQSVNTTDSAVRITHLPTGTVVTCQDEKSQLKNKAKAMNILRARLLDKKQQEEAKQLKDKRLMQIGSGDRSEKIRTYNYPQDRITDHRINYTQRNLNSFMAGEIDDLLEALKQAQVDLTLNEN